jgi:hypothetical protein
MVPTPPLVERAYQLARSGEYATISAIKAQLKIEHYVHVDRHMQGAAILRDLRRLCASARPAGARSQA